MKPSSDWLARLKLVIQECKAETGTEFVPYFLDIGRQITYDTGNLPTDYDLAKFIDKLKTTV